jgi:hypothetical protein
MQYEFIKLLAERKLLDTIQFVHSTEFKLFSAKLSINALKRLFVEQVELNETEKNAMFEEAIEKGYATVKATRNDVNYLGEEVGRNIVIDKLVMEIFSILHSFFDNFAQVINAMLFASNGIQKLGKVSYSAVIKMLSNFTEYSGAEIIKLLDVQTKDEYIYISDFNNIVKHRHQIFVKGKFNLFNGDSILETSKFHKDSNFHDSKEVIKIIEDCYQFCHELFNDFMDYAETYYTTNKNQYVENRVYNPKTELIFKCEEDAKAMKNPKNSIHYIELDSLNLKPEYYVLLIKPNDDIERFEIYNSTYDFIAVRDKVTKKNVAYLVPADNETYDMKDGRLIHYRKYRLETVNFQFEIGKKTLDSNMRVFPLLSDTTVYILNGKE